MTSVHVWVMVAMCINDRSRECARGAPKIHLFFFFVVVVVVVVAGDGNDVYLNIVGRR